MYTAQLGVYTLMPSTTATPFDGQDVALSLTDPDMIKPAYLWIPDRAGSYGQDVIDLAVMAGMTFDPEQVLCIDAIASHDRYGNWTAPEVAIIEPRQNGKTMNVVLPLTLWDLFEGPVTSEVDEMMHTAHRFKTSNKTFERMKSLIDGCYDLRREVKKISESHGDESIELTNGAMLMFLARSDVGGRGLGGKRVDLDEGFAVQSGQLGAVAPTMLARSNSQLVWSSSAGLARSGPLREIRDRGRAGGDADLIYIEFTASGSWDKPGCAQGIRCSHHRSVAGCALDRPEHQAVANPAMRHGRIQPRKIQMMRKTMTPLEFGREILGWWDPAEEDDVVPIELEKWNACADEGSQIVGPVAIVFDVSPDRRTAAVGVAGHTAAGAIHGELATYFRGGPAGVVDQIDRMINGDPEDPEYDPAEIMTYITGEGRNRRRKPMIVCDPAGPAASLLPDFQKRGIHVRLLTARELGAACGGLQDAVDAGPAQWVHLGQAEVDLAVEGAVRRDIGDGGWAFGRRKSAAAAVDICPLVTVALARWAVTVASPLVLPRSARG